MARGYLDWVSSSDKREVVVRPTLVTATGKVFMYDDFNVPNLVWSGAGAPGYTIDIVTDEFYSGGGSLILSPVAAASATASAYREIPIPESDIIGVEVVFKLETGFNGLFYIDLQRSEDEHIYFGRLKYDGTTKEWSLENSLGNFEVISGATSKYTKYTHTFFRVKFVVDFANKVYKYCIVRNKFIDLSAYPIYHQILGDSHSVRITLRNYAKTLDLPKDMWIDNVVITQEE